MMTQAAKLTDEKAQIIQKTFEAQRANRYQMMNSSVSYRINKLNELKAQIMQQQDNLKEALKLDMGRPGMEADLVEIMPVISEINFVIKHLKSWTKDKSVSTPALYTGTKSWVRHEAKGNCLLIGPWNYPFHLIFYPLVSAIAAGNTAMMKPSEFTPNVSKVIHQVVKNVFDANEVFVIDGGIDVSDMLLNLPFDHIFFTGSTRVGQIVMEKAAKHLASVTLELGGKSPVVIDKNVDIEEAAHKVAWGKFINAGQTCIAPDYVWVHEDIATAFIDAFKKTLEKFLTDENEGFTSIINEAHFKRLAGWLEEAKQAGGKIEVGGHCDEATNKIEMTLISEPGECTLMNEEIFGPILPLKTYSTTKEVIEGIQAQGYPLALYIFSKNNDWVENILNNTTSGGVAINEVILHNANHHLPFGGVGPSGLGHYHGEWGFKEFSHTRAVLKRNMEIGMKYFYPPYTEKKRKTVKGLFDKFSKFF